MSNREYPVLVTRDLIIFPNNAIPLTIASRRNRKAIDRAISQDGLILVVPIRNSVKTGEAEGDDLFRFGTLCQVEKNRTHPKSKNYSAVIKAIHCIQIHAIHACPESQDLLIAQMDHLTRLEDLDAGTRKDLLNAGKGLAIEILELSQGNAAKGLTKAVKDLKDPEAFIYLCASNLDLLIKDKIDLIANPSLKERLVKVVDQLHLRKNSLEVQIEVNNKLSSQMDRKQRDMILREQLQAIRDELGDLDEGGIQSDYFSKIEASSMPETIKKLMTAEARRLEATPAASPEAPNIRNYLDLMLDLPWQPPEHKTIDIQEARSILNRDHFGMDKVKDRIVQHLAVTQLNKGHKGSILLLLGPPGVGKTSLGKSIAEAMGKEFVRISLGGVRDEAEIRGHRRTYLGSMPGRIIQGIKRAQVNNPVFLLDEIDKLGQGWGGDPASALLEALDPEQNSNFEDHYLDAPFDLSHVMFIGTANSLDGIPGPLRDRMEIIHLSGYTSEEKLHIAQEHLWSTEMEKHGLCPYSINIGEDVFTYLINRYTRESGVRDLRRKLAALCRYLSEQVLLRPDADSYGVGLEQLEDILGPEIFDPENAETFLQSGVVTGLAWTPMGGDILFIESKLMPGKGKLTITGQLGDVMKESLHIAMSHVRSHLSSINPLFDYEAHDIHVHVPAGAIPKDGPSAGITMLCSLISLLAHQPIRSSLAMSGELSLRGTIMPVGGIKEKVIAAHRAGIREIILARKNQKDLKEVPQKVREDITFHLAESVEDVVTTALGLKWDFNKMFAPESYRANPASLS